MAADVWFAITVFGLFMYVALDGYDLGIGVLTLGVRDANRRRRMIGLVATGWDGNESWLVLTGVALYAGLPGFYSTALPATYLPLIVMLLALIFRGVAIELAGTSPADERRWDWVFGIGSLTAAFTQGAIFGALAKGLGLSATGQSQARSWDFLSWYSILGGITAVALYALAGAAWTSAQTAGDLQAQMRRVGRFAAGFVVALVALMAGCLPVVAEGLTTGTGRSIVLAWCCAVAALLLGLTWRGLGRNSTWAPTLMIIGAELVGLGGFLSLRVPHLAKRLTIAQASSPDASVQFLLIGVGLIIPIVLAYNAYAFSVFRKPGAAPRSSLTPDATAYEPGVSTAPAMLQLPTQSRVGSNGHRRHARLSEGSEGSGPRRVAGGAPPALPIPVRLAVIVVLTAAITTYSTVAINWYSKDFAWLDRSLIGMVSAGVVVTWVFSSRRHPATQDIIEDSADTPVDSGAGRGTHP